MKVKFFESTTGLSGLETAVNEWLAILALKPILEELNFSEMSDGHIILSFFYH